MDQSGSSTQFFFSSFPSTNHDNVNSMDGSTLGQYDVKPLNSRFVMLYIVKLIDFLGRHHPVLRAFFWFCRVHVCVCVCDTGVLVTEIAASAYQPPLSSSPDTSERDEIRLGT